MSEIDSNKIDSRRNAKHNIERKSRLQAIIKKNIKKN